VFSLTCAQSQLSPKKEEELCIKYSTSLLSFFKRPEQSATPKDIRLRRKTFALWVRVALMNIWDYFKTPPAQ